MQQLREILNDERIRENSTLNENVTSIVNDFEKIINTEPSSLSDVVAEYSKLKNIFDVIHRELKLL